MKRSELPENFVVCLIDNSLHHEITSKVTRDRGMTLAEYKRTYPDAPLKAQNSYAYELTDADIENRKKSMSEKWKDPTWRQNRQAAIKAYFNSIYSKAERKARQKRTKWQHENTDIEQKLRESYRKIETLEPVNGACYNQANSSEDQHEDL